MLFNSFLHVYGKQTDTIKQSTVQQCVLPQRLIQTQIHADSKIKNIRRQFWR